MGRKTSLGLLLHFIVCHSKKCHRPRTSSCHKEQRVATSSIRVVFLGYAKGETHHHISSQLDALIVSYNMCAAFKTATKASRGYCVWSSSFQKHKATAYAWQDRVACSRSLNSSSIVTPCCRVQSTPAFADSSRLMCYTLASFASWLHGYVFAHTICGIQLSRK